MYCIIINATAIKTSGALTILKDCIAYLESIPKINTEYHLFTVLNNFKDLKNIRVNKLEPQNWVSRIAWDEGGLQDWCIAHDIQPDLIISLQNTSAKFFDGDGKRIPQLVYYHQPLPLTSYKWNIFNRQEFILFLYAYFYSFFVARNSKSSYYVVQLSCIRELFFKKFKKVKRDRVFVIRPNNPLIDVTNTPKIFLDKDFFTFFYPATALRYKNHSVLILALILLREKYYSVLCDIKIVFTVETLDIKLMKLIEKYYLLDIIQFIGQKSYDEVLSYYKSADALLFPSQIETFGLPLAEAACFGLPVIAADLPYAHEVLEKYPNKEFVGPEDRDGWANILKNYKRFKKAIPPAHADAPMNKNSWEFFFDLADNILMDNQYNNP